MPFEALRCWLLVQVFIEQGCTITYTNRYYLMQVDVGRL